MVVKGICAKDDFKRSEVLKNGLRIVRFDETTDENGMMSFSEETVENSVEGAKELLKRLINEYDVSSEVNGFTISHEGKELVYWLPAEKRGQLATGIAARKACGSNSYTLDLREYGMSIDVDCDKLSDMLSKLENYAVESYNATSKHLNEVTTITGIDTLLTYDYKAGYPERLSFTL